MSAAEEKSPAYKNIQNKLFFRILRHSNISTDSVLSRHNNVLMPSAISQNRQKFETDTPSG